MAPKSVAVAKPAAAKSVVVKPVVARKKSTPASVLIGIVVFTLLMITLPISLFFGSNLGYFDPLYELTIGTPTSERRAVTSAILAVAGVNIVVGVFIYYAFQEVNDDFPYPEAKKADKQDHSATALSSVQTPTCPTYTTQAAIPTAGHRRQPTPGTPRPHVSPAPAQQHPPLSPHDGPPPVSQPTQRPLHPTCARPHRSSVTTRCLPAPRPHADRTPTHPDRALTAPRPRPDRAPTALRPHLDRAPTAPRPRPDRTPTAPPPHPDRTPTAPRPHPDRTPTALRPHPDRTPTAPRPHPDRAPTAPRPHLDRASTAPRPRLDRAPTARELPHSRTTGLPAAVGLTSSHRRASPAACGSFTRLVSSLQPRTRLSCEPHGLAAAPMDSLPLGPQPGQSLLRAQAVQDLSTAAGLAERRAAAILQRFSQTCKVTGKGKRPALAKTASDRTAALLQLRTKIQQQLTGGAGTGHGRAPALRRAAYTQPPGNLAQPQRTLQPVSEWHASHATPPAPPAMHLPPMQLISHTTASLAKRKGNAGLGRLYRSAINPDMLWDESLLDGSDGGTAAGAGGSGEEEWLDAVPAASFAHPTPPAAAAYRGQGAVTPGAAFVRQQASVDVNHAEQLFPQQQQQQQFQQTALPEQPPHCGSNVVQPQSAASGWPLVSNIPAGGIVLQDWGRREEPLAAQAPLIS
ncbi:MAG: hypothetical protein WDW36_009424 [Sanguina aurantia]